MGGRADRREKAVRSALGHAPVAPDGRRCIVLCTNLHRPSPAARAGPRAYWRSVVSERYAAHELSSELSLKAKKRLQDQHRDRIVPFSQSSCATWDKSFTPCTVFYYPFQQALVAYKLSAYFLMNGAVHDGEK